MSIQWMDKEYFDAPSYYKEVVLTMPQENGVILGAETHIDALAHLTKGGIYVADQDPSDIYVAEWLVNRGHLAHRLKEFGLQQTGWSTGVIECDLQDGSCDICMVQVPGPIEMIHNFYKLDG